MKKPRKSDKISTITLFSVIILLLSSQCFSKNDLWTLRTSDTQISICASDDYPVITSLINRDMKYNWVEERVYLPLMKKVWVNNKEIPLNWKYKKSSICDKNDKLTLYYKNTEPNLLLKSVWLSHEGPGPIEHYIEIENLSEKIITVSQQQSLSLKGINAGSSAELTWIRRGAGNARTEGGTYEEKITSNFNLDLISDCEKGNSPVPWLNIQVIPNHGLYIGWEFTGIGEIKAETLLDPNVLFIDIGLKSDFKTEISAGQTFKVPAAFVGCYSGDIDDGSYNLHRFIMEHLRPALPQDHIDPTLAYNVIWDSDGVYCWDINEAGLLKSAEICHDLGFEIFVPDAMWYPEIGDWRFEPNRFPSGITPIETFVHRNDLKLGLWCAWTNGGTSEHPEALSVTGPHGHMDWFRTYATWIQGSIEDPNWKPWKHHGAQLCLGCEEAKDWAINKTNELVSTFKLDYLKHDFGPVITTCDRETHRHKFKTDVSYWSAMNYYEVYEKLLEKHPNLILENCATGGLMKDFGAIKRTHYITTTDTLAELPNRQSMYDSTFAFPPALLMAYTIDYWKPGKGNERNSFLWRSAMMGAWQIDPRSISNWTNEEIESVRRSVKVYKKWLRPVIKKAKVHHILPRPDGINWDGMFYWASELKKGTVYIFRPNSDIEEKTVKLKGLDNNKKYWFWCEDGSIKPNQKSGKQLMEQGLEIALPAKYTSDIIFIQETSLGKPKYLNKTPGEFNLKEAKSDSGYFSASAVLLWDYSKNANSYRLVVAENPDMSEKIVNTMVLTGNSMKILELKPKQDYYWEVEAIGYGGKCLNKDNIQHFKTSQLKTFPGSFVSDIKWKNSTTGALDIKKNINFNSQNISIGQKEYPKGILTHSFADHKPADIIIDIAGKNYSIFASDVGLEDSASGPGSVKFQVLVDGVIKAESPVMKPSLDFPFSLPRKDSVYNFYVNIKSAKEITLRVLNGGDGQEYDHAAWGLARFINAGNDDPLLISDNNKIF